MNSSNEPAAYREHNISFKVLHYVEHIRHHYSQYLVTATRFMWPWGALREAWSNLKRVTIVTVAPIGAGDA